MRFLFSLAWRDLRASGRHLWIFCACLVLGVALVTAGGGLYRQVAGALTNDARLLFGGDVEVEQTAPLAPEVLAWMKERGDVSRLVELRTMLRAPDGRAQLIELQSADVRYPLYGTVELAPAGDLTAALTERDGVWGAALDATLAQRLDLKPGDTVEVGNLSLQVRALVVRQPDRSLRADWGAATGLVQPLSRVEYHYRVRTPQPAAEWRDAFMAAYPDLQAEVRTFEERSDRMAEVLGQIGSGLLLIGFSALFIGGLGVFNSVQAYLQGKLGTLATLRAVGLRDGRLAALVLLQILMLALLSSLGGVLIGNALALGGTLAAAQQLPLAPLVVGLWLPSLVGLSFGVLTALTFALPALGRALSVSPAALFRGIDGNTLKTPRRVWWLTGGVAAVVGALVVASVPDARFGLAFVVATVLLLGLLEGVTRVLRGLARRQLSRPGATLPFELRLAMAGLQRSDSPLRAALLSLGAALTLLVACTLVVTSLLRTVNETVPANAPAMVFYDVQTEQIALLQDTLKAQPGLMDVTTAPLVLGRLIEVNGEVLRDSGDGERVREARDEQRRRLVARRPHRSPAGGHGRPRGRPARPEGGRPIDLRDPGRTGAGRTRRHLQPAAPAGAAVAGRHLQRRCARPLHHAPRGRRLAARRPGPGRARPVGRCRAQHRHRAHRIALARNACAHGPRQHRSGGDCRRVPRGQPAGAGQRGGQQPRAPGV